MIVKDYVENIELAEGVTASELQSVLTIKGEKGEVTRSFLYPTVKIKVEQKTVGFLVPKMTKTEKKIVKTFLAHVRNMVRGVTEGHVYKLKICSGHFPMNVSIKGNKLEIKNFIGEAVPRVLNFKEGVDVKVEGDTITVSGIDKELIAQSAANIENITRRNGFDRRVFQDGIYIIEKDGKLIS